MADLLDLAKAGSVMTGLTLVFGTILAVAYRFLKVFEDPRIDAVEEMLPGSNCGACGEPGCRALAEKVTKGVCAPGLCSVNTPEGVEAIATLLGVDAGFGEKRVARLHCAGEQGAVGELAQYSGIKSCQAASVVNGGGRACPWGCLGLGDCDIACSFDAIVMNSGGLPSVIVDKCTACGDCVDACPLGLFAIQSLAHPLLVQCSSPLSGDEARESCAVACDTCGRCVMDSETGVLEMKNNLPTILQPENTTIKATYRCPSHAIQWIEKNQFMNHSPAKNLSPVTGASAT